MGKAGLRGRLRRLAGEPAPAGAPDVRTQCASRGAVPLASCAVGRHCVVAGTVRSVRLAPVGGVPTFTVDLWDESGSVRLVFLGRRTVRGLEVGRTLLARGRLTGRAGRQTIFNPRYEIILPPRA